LRALEGMGAALEAPRPGVVFFDAEGLLGLHHSPGGVIASARDALARPSRIGSGPTRFCALAAAMTSRSRRARIVEDRDARRYLAGQPVGLLAYRPETVALVGALERLGIEMLGDLALLKAAQVADRFGAPGTIARRLALGYDEPLRTRRVEDQLRESMTLGELNSGEALSRTLGVLVDRLIARPERRGRTFRAIALSARVGLSRVIRRLSQPPQRASRRWRQTPPRSYVAMNAGAMPDDIRIGGERGLLRSSTRLTTRTNFARSTSRWRGQSLQPKTPQRHRITLLLSVCREAGGPRSPVSYPTFASARFRVSRPHFPYWPDRAVGYLA
jgi:nucleotidyltransferase/DNA polymerase involved in DNA repair